MRCIRFLCLVLFLAALPVGYSQDVFKQSDGMNCPLEGTAKSADGKAIDRLKNRFVGPEEGDMDTNVSLAALLTPGDDVGRFDQSKGAKISGFVVDVKVGGVETCNCRAKDPSDRDTHIEIGFTKDADKRQKVIVEVTPRMRAKMKAAGEDWSTDALKQSIKGKWIDVTGWFLFDTPHMNEAENTHPGGPKNWRATCWEIHPITKIDVMEAPPADTPILHPNLLRAFHQVQAQHFKNDTSRNEKTMARNKEHVGRFPKEDLDEELPIPK
jgi:hypothetical protein